MRNRLIFAVAALALLSPAAFAQATDAGPDGSAVPGPAPQAETGAVPGAGGDTGGPAGADAATDIAPDPAGILAELRPDDLVGKSVRSSDGDALGEIAQVTEGAAGQQVLVSTGGFLGIGAKTVALDPETLSFDPENDAVVVNMTKEELRSLPEYEG